jgi:hypothetical protein
MGMNAHLTFPCSINHIDELCKSMADAGVSMVRLDLYWSPKNMYYQRRDFDRAAYYVTKYGMSIELNMPQIPLNIDNNTLTKWSEVIGYYAKRYDGNTVIDIGNGEEPRKICIRHFEIMNEPEHWQNSGLSVELFYKYVKLATETIRKVRQQGDALIVLPGISNQCSYNERLLEYRDSDGKGLKDYIDIWNFHYYSTKEDKMWDELSSWITFFYKHNGLGNKPIWMTEFGHSLWEQTEDKQGQLLPKQALVAAALGVDKIFYYQFHQFGGNYFSKRQKEDFFGIIDTSIKNSYGSFWENDGIYKTAICDGDGSRKIYITPRRGNNFSLYTLTESICRKLKTSGVAIGGKGFTIDSVILKKKNGINTILYTGNFIISQKGICKILRLHKNYFRDVEQSDILVVKIKNVTNLSNQWNGLHPLKSFYTYKTMVKELEGCHNVFHDNRLKDITVLRWNVGSLLRYAIWSNTGKNIMVKLMYGSHLIVVTQSGDRSRLKKKSIMVNDEVKYLECQNNIFFNI